MKEPRGGRGGGGGGGGEGGGGKTALCMKSEEHNVDCDIVDTQGTRVCGDSPVL
jgi:hypothetical protein